MKMIPLSPSGNFQMPEELQEFELANLPSKGTVNCRYLRLGRQNGESLNAYAAPRIPPGWKQVRLVSFDQVLFIEFERVPPPAANTNTPRRRTVWGYNA